MNGYSNRETWALALWLDNDHGLRNMVVEKITSLVVEDRSRDDVTTMTGDYVRGLYDDLWEAASQPGAYVDVLNMLQDVGSGWRINWHELAKGYLE
jgi:type IV secretory pathway TrbF-like protein